MWQFHAVSQSFTLVCYFWHCCYSAALSPNRPVSMSLPHEVTVTSPEHLHLFGKMNCSIAAMQNEIKTRLGGLQKRDRSSCVSFAWNVALQSWKIRSSRLKCCQTLRNEIETRASRADRTNFGSEDIEWWVSDACYVVIETGVDWWGFHTPFRHPHDHRWHQQVI